MKILKNLFAFTALIILTNCAKEDPLPLLYEPGNGVVDASGNFYPTVIIGNMEWMAEDLKSHRFCDGDQIPLALNNWPDMQSAAFRLVPTNFNGVREDFYFYNYYAVRTIKNICPCGWFVPAKSHWDRLINLLGGIHLAGFELGNPDLFPISNNPFADGDTREEDEYGRSGLNFVPNHRLSSLGSFFQTYNTSYWIRTESGNTDRIFDFNILFNHISFPEKGRGEGYSVRCIRLVN
jgi:uncharacterized protein (TIGR02145 family)